MDPFTEKLLERTRARRENLQRKIAERPASGTRPLVKRSREPLTESNTVICETVSEKALPSNLSPIKRRCSDENTLLTKEENRQRSPAPMISSDPMTDKKPPLASRSIHPLMVEKKPSHYLPEPVRQPSHCASAVKMVSPPQSQVKSTNIERKNFALDGARETCQDTPTSFPNSMRSRLQKLAEQRQCWESEGASETVQESISPLKIQKAEPPLTPASQSSGFSTGRKGRFANLAAKIGSWEDDQAQRATTQVQLDIANVTPVSTMTKPAVYSSIKSNREVHTSPQKIELPRTKLAQSVSSQSPLKNQKTSNVHFEAPVESSTSKPILTPKPKYSAHPTVVPKSPEKLVKISTPMEHRSTVGTSGVKSFLERFEEKCQERSQNSTSTTTAATPKTRMIQERLVAMPSISSTAILTQKQKKEREAELAEIRNRSPMPPSEKKISEEPELSLQSKLLVSPKTNDLATVPANQNNPSKSSTKDLECSLPNDSKQNGDFSITVGGKKTHEAEETNEVHDIEIVDGSVTSEIINELFDGVLDESDDVGDDALNISSMSLLAPLSETVATVIRSPVRDLMTSTPAGSFNMKSSTPNNVSKPGIFQNTCILASESSDSIDSIDAQPNQNLLYSIDAYRSTRVKTTERPHVKEMAKKEDVSQKRDTAGPFSHAKVKQKIKNLTNEMNLQQTVIHQASQALNCCTDEEHGKGSQVEAEAERLLLIATERRAALKAELDQLKSEDQKNKKRITPNAQADMAISASKGSISLLELRLPLKADFICSSIKKPEAGSHYFFVMIRSGAENTVSTPLANTCNALSGDALTFTTKFTLSNVSNDFEIDIEVYCFLQKRELNSDKRKKPSKSKAITPKRFLAISKSNLQTPVMASPGGPNAVRTSNFVLVGSHKITLASIGKNKFPLEKIKYEGNERQLLSDMFHHKVPFLCPLEGHVYLKMQCEVGSGVEEKGFLTMFEDVSGFGAWHRRWCVLSGYSISYWTYPDHEKRKNPIGRINLANCTSRKIEPANREFCARPNTFELITVRPQKEDDCETLVTQCKNTLCVTKNWLSADTKDERNLWMMKINQILVDLRTWQPDSCYKPM